MDKHISTQFDSELRHVCTLVLSMGGLVETQIQTSLQALSSFDIERAAHVLAAETQVNQYELDIDRALIEVIARRQPTARDLRLLMALSHVTQNLERVGDEAERIARMVQRIHQTSTPLRLPTTDLSTSAALATTQMRKALDAFARLDLQACVAVLREDASIDALFNAFVRQLITYMMEDAKTISPSLDLLFVAKAIERIGDHAKNIAESVIYIVKGEDVRHASLEAIEAAIGQEG